MLWYDMYSVRCRSVKGEESEVDFQTALARSGFAKDIDLLRESVHQL